MSDTLSYSGTLTVMTCWCGITHAVPSELAAYQRRCHDDGRRVPDIFCPVGHGHVPAGKPRVAVLERKLANRDEDLRAERASHAATKGQLTKTRKRVGNGVCPCCNRHFANVGRHMASQHPEYKDDK